MHGVRLMLHRARCQVWLQVAVLFTSFCPLPSANKAVNTCRIFFGRCEVYCYLALICV